MSEKFYNPTHETHEPGHEVDETLRLLAALPEPDGLTDRVHQRLSHAQVTPERRGFWSLWMPAQRFQFAAAGVLAVAVAGSMWSLHRSHPPAAGAQNAPAATHAAQGGSPADAGGFHSAGAERVPPTLHPIKVPPAPKKKPGAGHAAKPSPKVLANQTPGTQADVKPATNP
jgi:hypothetical protein